MKGFERIFVVFLVILPLHGQGRGKREIRPGVWAGNVDSVPLPATGYQVYLAGELHGLEQNQTFAIEYLTQLHNQSGLRDVAIEEDGAYQSAAQAFVQGISPLLPHALCLRSGILNAIRQLNAKLAIDQRIRVHLTDIDSPLPTIRQHVLDVRGKLGADHVAIPMDAPSLLNTLTKLDQSATDPQLHSELRTIRFSLEAFRQGFEVDVGPSKGSPYLESREQAIAENIIDLVRTAAGTGLLVLYGSDHVSRTLRKDGGPKRNQPFEPMAARLEKSGLTVFSVVTFPIEGHSNWRGQSSELPWTAADGHLTTGETLEKLLLTAPEAEYFYIDRMREPVRLPSQDLSDMNVNAFVLFRYGFPMLNRCAQP